MVSGLSDYGHWPHILEWTWYGLEVNKIFVLSTKDD